MPTPVLRPAEELPVYSWSEWDSVQLVKAALRDLELGLFDQSSQVVDAMGRDDRISGCLLTRVEALPALPFCMQPAPGQPEAKAKKVAEAAQELFETMCPNAELLKLQHWGVMQGIGLAQNLWERAPGNVTGKQWIPRLKVWHPRMLYYRLDAEELIVHTRDGDRVVESGDGEWVVYAPYGLHRGWMYGKIRSLYVPWLVRQWGWRDWARHSEVHGMPIRKAITPTSADEKDKQRFLKEVARLGSENVIRLPKALDGTQFDLELLEAAADGHLVFKELLAQADSSVAIALLGQNLTTEVKAGSFAAAQVHQNIRSDILRGDAQNLGLMLREQVLKPWARFNFGDAELAPTPTWSTDPPRTRARWGPRW
jgi:phage gp29-like protein